MKDWYKDSVVYQIYTRSFKDSNGDGVGDFGGVIQKLDYLADLGVDVLWLSPFCDSPNDDNGYDISDYLTIMPEFGTLDDFNALVAGAHERKMKIMMDLVMNHTSDEHPWFIESRSSKDNPKRDWYLWAAPSNDPGDGQPEVGFDQAGRGFPGRARGPVIPGYETGYLPNNWDSYFGGKAWEFDPVTGEYYCHIFSKKQPDLNWANPEVRHEMYRIAEWWISRGVDAFRLDAVHHIGKPEGWPDAPIPKEPWGFCLYKNTQQTHEYLKEMNSRVFAPHQVLTVGETGGTTPESARLYVDSDRHELDMIFHFSHVHMPDPNNAAALRGLMNHWYSALKPRGWDAQFFSNHDLPRQVSAFGDDRWLRGKSAKAIATLLMTGWGTPYIYQGEEIGMTNAHFPSIEDFRDLHALRGYYEGIQQGEDPELVMSEFQRRNRDNSRTPMQWDGSVNAGFCPETVLPWISVPKHARLISVATEQKNSLEYDQGGIIAGAGILNWYKDLIALRKTHPVLRRGAYTPIGAEHSQVLVFARYLDGSEGLDTRISEGSDATVAALILINWTGNSAVLNLPAEGIFSAGRGMDGDGYLLTPPLSQVQKLERTDFRLVMANYFGNQSTGSNTSGGTTGAADFGAALGGDYVEIDVIDQHSDTGLPVIGRPPAPIMTLRPWECRIYLSRHSEKVGRV